MKALFIRSMRLFVFLAIGMFHAQAAFAQPANDNCQAAVPITPNLNFTCIGSISGTTLNATDSGINGCNGNQGDVWYSFTASSTAHYLYVSDIVDQITGFPTNLEILLWSGGCNSLSLVNCYSLYNQGQLLLPALVVGETYQLQVIGWGIYNPTTFDLCLLTPPAPPANDECSGAVSLAVGVDQNYVTTTGTTAGATYSVSYQSCFGYSADVWYSFTATNSVHIVVFENAENAISGAPNEFGFELYSGVCNSNLNYERCYAGNVHGNQAIEGLTPGATYFIKVIQANPNAPFNFEIGVTTPTPAVNDECADAIPVPVSGSLFCPNPLNSNNMGATITPGHCNNGYDVWFSFVATDPHHLVTLSNVQSIYQINTYSYDANLEVFSGDCGNLTPKSCTSVFGYGYHEFFDLVPGDTYYCRVSGNYLPFVDFHICVRAFAPTPPNTDCANAMALTVDSDDTCDAPVSGSTESAIPSLPIACNGDGTSGLWYSFTATQSSHTLSLSNVAGLLNPYTVGLRAEIYEGGCNSTAPMHCIHVGLGSVQQLGGFTPGNTYLVRVASFWSSDLHSFDICVSTPAATPTANDECNNAVAITPDQDDTCDAVVAGTTLGASKSPYVGTACDGAQNEVWYSFVATSPAHRVNITNIRDVNTNEESAAVLNLYSGTCSNLSVLSCNSLYGNQGGYSNNNAAFNIGETYYFRVFAPYQNSINFDVCVTTYFPPANDECVNAVPLTPASVGETCSSTLHGTTVAATATANINNCYGYASPDVWYQFTATSTTHIVEFFNTVNPFQNEQVSPEISLFNGTCSGLNYIFCNNTSSTGPIALTNLDPGGTYFLKVSGLNGTEIDFDICLTTPAVPANDRCQEAVELTPSPDEVCQNLVAGTTQNSYSNDFYNYCYWPGGDVWYKFTATSQAHRVAITDAVTLDGNCGSFSIQVFAGSCSNLQPITCQSGYCNGSMDIGGLVAGETYWVKINDYYAYPTNFNICVLTLPPPPANDVCQQATPLALNTYGSCQITASGTTQNALQEYNNYCYLTNSVWYTFVADSPIMHMELSNVVNPANEPAYAYLELGYGGCQSLNFQLCQGYYGSGSYTFFNLIPGEVYHIKVGSSAPEVITFDLCLQNPPPTPVNDLCTNATNLVPAGDTTCITTVSGTNFFATASYNNYCYYGNHDVWYSFTATGPIHQLAFDSVLLHGTTDCFYANFELFTGDCNNGLNHVTCFQATCGSAQLLTDLVPGQQYLLRASTYDQSNFVDFEFCLVTPYIVPNDVCGNAIDLTVDQDETCDLFTTGTTADSYPASQSSNCYGYGYSDVWYKFTATSTAHRLNIQNVYWDNSPDYCGHVYGAILRGDCQNTTLLQCLNFYCSGYIDIPELTPGDEYLINLSSYSAIDFELCVTTLPPQPANDACANAIPLSVGNHGCAAPVSGTTLHALYSTSDQSCYNGPANNVWYNFTATGTEQLVELSNIYAAGTTNPSDAVLTVFQGTCGNMYYIGCQYLGTEGRLSLLNLTPGETYYITVQDSYFGYGAVDFDICVFSPPIPANDECANAADLPANPDIYCQTTVQGTTLGATTGGLNCFGENTSDVWYAFTAASSGHVLQFYDLNILQGDYYQTGFEVYSGQCGTLTSLGCQAGPYELIVNGLTVGETYYVRVYATQGTIFNFSLCLKTLPPTPANDECAGALPLIVNSDVYCLESNNPSTLGASQSGSTCFGGGNTSDVWYYFVATSPVHRLDFYASPYFGDQSAIGYEVYSGNNCGGLNTVHCQEANFNSTTLNTLTVGETYYVRVFSYGNSQHYATLCIITLPPPPANDDCANAITIVPNSDESCATPTPGTTASATPSPENGNSYCQFGNDTWYKFVATSTTHFVHINNVQIAYGGYYALAFNVLQGDCTNGFLPIACFDWYYGTPQAVNGLTPGQTYYIAVSGTNDVGYTFDLCIGSLPPPPANDACEQATVIAVNPGMDCVESLSGSTSGATDNGNYVGCGSYRDVWYQFTATSSSHLIQLGNIAASIGGNSDLYMDIFSGDCNGNLQPIFTCNYASSGVEALGFLTVGQTYFIRVFSVGNTVHSYDLCVLTLPPPPANDECWGAIALPVSTSEACQNPTQGTTLGSTSSNYYCTGSDVWFKFTATGSEHKLWIQNVQSLYGNQYLYFDVYTGDCNFLNNLTSCYPSYFAESGHEMGGFQAGSTYYIRVYSNFGTANNFDICITPSHTNVAMLSIFPETNCAPGSNANVMVTYQNTGNVAIPAGSMSSLITAGNGSYGLVYNSDEVQPGAVDTLVFSGVDLSATGMVGFEALLQPVYDEIYWDNFMLLEHEILPGTYYFADADGDGFGDGSAMQLLCAPQAGFVTNNSDCNDSNANVYPDAPEVCDNADNDCDGQVDANDPDFEAVITINSVSVMHQTCVNMANGKITINATGAAGSQLVYSINGGTTYQLTNVFTGLLPGTYNIKVNVQGTTNCSATTTATVNAATPGPPPTWYKDIDNDGYSNGQIIVNCTQPNGYKPASALIATTGDCNDNDPLQFPGQIWYKDADNDGYSDGTTKIQCTKPSNHKAASQLVATSGDCNDTKAAINPAATETCNGIDDDCDGIVDDGLANLTYIGNVTLTTQAQVNAWPQCFTAIQGNLVIKNAGITSLAPLSNLVSVTGSVTIQSTGLTHLGGLSSLTTIGGSLTIKTNTQLATLDGLESLASVGNILQVYYNFKLADCCAIHNLLNTPGAIGGTVAIYGNKTGCDNLSQINSNCQGNLLPQLPFGSDAQTNLEQDIEVYPNPVASLLNIRIPGGYLQGRLVVTDAAGRLVHTASLEAETLDYQWECGRFAPGLYQVAVTLDGGKTMLKKVVVE